MKVDVKRTEMFLIIQFITFCLLLEIYIFNWLVHYHHICDVLDCKIYITGNFLFKLTKTLRGTSNKTLIMDQSVNC